MKVIRSFWLCTSERSSRTLCDKCSCTLARHSSSEGAPTPPQPIAPRGGRAPRGNDPPIRHRSRAELRPGCVRSPKVGDPASFMSKLLWDLHELPVAANSPKAPGAPGGGDQSVRPARRDTNNQPPPGTSAPASPHGDHAGLASAPEHHPGHVLRNQKAEPPKIKIKAWRSLPLTTEPNSSRSVQLTADR